MIKILYDTQPYNLQKHCQQLFSESAYTCMAICGSTTVIFEVFDVLLKEYLLSHCVLAWIRAEESTIEKLKDTLHSDSYTTSMKASGLLTFSLPESCFELLEEDREFFIQQFDQFYSMELHIVDRLQKNKILSYLSQHPKMVDVTHFAERSLIISKSGDEDELELVFPKNKAANIVLPLCRIVIGSE